jgi:hypothetical protein
MTIVVLSFQIRVLLLHLRIMFRTITAIILLFAFAAQTFNRSVIILDFYTNQADFVKNCENKAKPKMHCKGKCQMMKKLEQEEKKDQQNPERKLENKNEVVSSKSSFATLQTEPIQIFNAFGSFFITARPIDRSFAIFHPPIA